MHELSVTESILAIALDHAQKAKASKVTDINLVIGRLSSIIDDSVSFYWEIISKDTICSDAKLHFTRLPATFVCINCNTQYSVKGELEPCPKCSSADVQVITGNEFRVDSIEVIQEN